ncbi:piggyBac transposable element-derived protein 3-like [Schistocerca serialis cubense]|uniref:piggyBac transposable element-derived protein 3-like n=1 Tax=Schistocerca serialis cubense TaxID=2023355 RepID=UPI00214F0BC9|nr:piggyBac transposable element-derived protein 3-like [Schistocerca serialis cubense]
MYSHGLNDEGILECLFADIPSDPDSQIDTSSDSESDVLAEDSDLDLRMKTPFLSQIISESESKDHFDNDGDDSLSTNDDLPLSSIANFSWTMDVSAMNFAGNFSEEAGVRGKLKNDSEEHLVFQSNLYTTQKGGIFRPLSKAELKVFLAINILMGIKKPCSYRDCWSSHKELRDEYISSLIWVKRFSWILTHVHINNNAVMPSRESRNYDKLYKIHPLINQILINFKEFYAPTKEQAIDECMVKFKGRIAFKQYMPQKPIKRGYKIWITADKLGYICGFQIYTGKVEGIVEKALGERIVRDMCKGLEGKGYHIYFDNFFTSVSLLQKLKDDGLFACGTIRSHRKGLPTLKTDK